MAQPVPRQDWRERLEDLRPLRDGDSCPHCGKLMPTWDHLPRWRGDEARPGWHATVYGGAAIAYPRWRR